MTAEIGLFALICALLFACFLSIIPVLGLSKKISALVAAAEIYARAQFAFVALSYLCLTICFLKDDFTVRYVLANSSLSLPWFYKICAVWGGHEGSMLLWVVILSFWMAAISLYSKALTLEIRARVLCVLGFISAGFILFLLMTSNPFLRQFQVLNSVGRDLNPLLQDLGFLFHPPMLYMGYVGFSVAFAFAIAALWAGQVDEVVAKWSRPWTLAAWCCLTTGITLGSWWAYRELGWGGWWFWDPVENASFMPWLIGTALLHSLAVCEKKQQFKAWTVLLAITAFSLSLIGTFLVRSGVLTSVHAFAVDPQRGLYILCFLVLVIGGSLLLFALRGHILQDDVKQVNKKIAFISRESALLLNNVFLVVIMLTILLGTLYPLIIDGLGLGKLSVGAPYFNAVFVPLVVPILFLMGIGVHLTWQRDKLSPKAWSFLNWVICCVVLAILFSLVFAEQINFYACLGIALALWIIVNTLQVAIKMIKNGRLVFLHSSFWGMVCAHLGVAVTTLGISISSFYGQQEDVKMAPGDHANLAGYNIIFLSTKQLQGPNYHGLQAQFQINHDKKSSYIYPEKRLYEVGKMAMTESAIDVNPFRDIYVALGEDLGSGYWAVRLYYKPFVRWIWGGGFLILTGGGLCLFDRRYYRQYKKSKILAAEPVL